MSQLNLPHGLQLRGLLPISLLGEQIHGGLNSLPKTVTRQRRGCDLNRDTSAPESSTLTTRYRATLRVVKRYATLSLMHVFA